MVQMGIRTPGFSSLYYRCSVTLVKSLVFLGCALLYNRALFLMNSVQAGSRGRNKCFEVQSKHTSTGGSHPLLSDVIVTPSLKEKNLSLLLSFSSRGSPLLMSWRPL